MESLWDQKSRGGIEKEVVYAQKYNCDEGRLSNLEVEGVELQKCKTTKKYFVKFIFASVVISSFHGDVSIYFLVSAWRNLRTAGGLKGRVQ